MDFSLATFFSAADMTRMGRAVRTVLARDERFFVNDNGLFALARSGPHTPSCLWKHYWSAMNNDLAMFLLERSYGLLHDHVATHLLVCRGDLKAPAFFSTAGVHDIVEAIAPMVHNEMNNLLASWASDQEQRCFTMDTLLCLAHVGVELRDKGYVWPLRGQALYAWIDLDVFYSLSKDVRLDVSTRQMVKGLIERDHVSQQRSLFLAGLVLQGPFLTLDGPSNEHSFAFHEHDILAHVFPTLDEQAQRLLELGKTFGWDPTCDRDARMAVNQLWQLRL